VRREKKRKEKKRKEKKRKEKKRKERRRCFTDVVTWCPYLHLSHFNKIE
jgi:hypothetical protein